MQSCDFTNPFSRKYNILYLSSPTTLQTYLYFKLLRITAPDIHTQRFSSYIPTCVHLTLASQVTGALEESIPFERRKGMKTHKRRGNICVKVRGPEHCRAKAALQISIWFQSQTKKTGVRSRSRAQFTHTLQGEAFLQGYQVTEQ